MFGSSLPVLCFPLCAGIECPTLCQHLWGFWVKGGDLYRPVSVVVGYWLGVRHGDLVATSLRIGKYVQNFF